jgi:serine protease Do
LCLSILFTSGSNWAANSRPDGKWETTRTTLPEDLDELKALEARVQKVVEKCTPATVGLLVTVGFAQGAGSGVIVSEDGLVLTAAHVITGDDTGGRSRGYEPGREIEIVLQDGKRVKAKTLGVNSDIDSGMVKIIDKGPNDGKWPFLPVAKSADLKSGQWVVSLGHPGGPKSGRPPVARLGRVESNKKEFVRSNCTLVGGDSGGPLFDLDGNVVGIHSRIGLTLAQNIHVPTEQFKSQWDKLVAGEVFGKVAKKLASAPFLGVVFPEDEEDDAWVTEEVDPETPAGKGGLKAGDTITKFNGETVKSVKRLRELIKEKKPGDAVKMTVRRGTTMVTLSVTLGKK